MGESEVGVHVKRGAQFLDRAFVLAMEHLGKSKGQSCPGIAFIYGHGAARSLGCRRDHGCKAALAPALMCVPKVQIAAGQAHELPHAVPLLARLPGVPKWVVGDRGYTSHRFRQRIWSMAARPAIPPQRHEAPVACPEWAYTNRNRVERLWARGVVTGMVFTSRAVMRGCAPHAISTAYTKSH